MWAQLCKQNLLAIHRSAWATESEAGSQASSSSRDRELAQGCSYYRAGFLVCFDFRAHMGRVNLAEPTLTGGSNKQTGFTAMT